jgi:hypothetical protein
MHRFLWNPKTDLFTMCPSLGPAFREVNPVHKLTLSFMMYLHAMFICMTTTPRHSFLDLWIKFVLICWICISQSSTLKNKICWVILSCNCQLFILSFTLWSISCNWCVFPKHWTTYTWRLRSSVMWHSVGLVRTDVLEDGILHSHCRGNLRSYISFRDLNSYSFHEIFISLL